MTGAHRAISTTTAGPTRRASSDAGVRGNSRLTSANGVLLLFMLAVEGFTVLNVRRMITLHVFLGVLLVGPVLLKVVSTAYRFTKYYRGEPAYVRKGPPHIVLRLLGPVVILTSLAVLGTGIGLLTVRPGNTGLWLLAHKASFILWFGAMTIHVLGHVTEAFTETAKEFRSSRRDPAGRRRMLRMAIIGVSVLAGTGLALALMPSAHVWTSHTAAFFNH